MQTCRATIRAPRRAGGLDQAREPHRLADGRARLGEGGEIPTPGEPVQRARDHRLIAGIDADHAIAGGDGLGGPDEAVAVQQHRRRGIRQQRLEGAHAGVPETRQIRDIVLRDPRLDGEVHQARALPRFAHRRDAFDRVGRRVGVRHAHHGGHPAAGRRNGAGGEGLLARIAGVAHMHMGIDEAREQEPPAGVDHGPGVGPGVRLDQRRDPPVIADDDATRPDPRLGHQTRVVYREQSHPPCFPPDYAIAGSR